MEKAPLWDRCPDRRPAALLLRINKLLDTANTFCSVAVYLNLILKKSLQFKAVPWFAVMQSPQRHVCQTLVADFACYDVIYL